MGWSQFAVLNHLSDGKVGRLLHWYWCTKMRLAATCGASSASGSHALIERNTGAHDAASPMS